MANIRQRISDFIEARISDYRDRLRGWMISWVTKSAEDFMDFLEPDLREAIKPSLSRLKEIEGLPDDFKAIIDKAMVEPKAVQLAAILPYLIGILIGMGMGAASPIMRASSYQIDKLVKSARLNPMEVITAWRRDPQNYEKLFDDLKDQGYSEERIEALKFVTLFYPSAQDLVFWQAKEVFEPDMQAKFGLTDEFEKLNLDMFAKAGVSKEQALNYWIAHWQYPSMGQVFDMYHRGEIKWDDVSEYMRLAELPPYWREKLEAISWNLPNRIELRMMARYGLVDKQFLIDILEKVGLHEDYRDIAADMMLVMGIQSDLSSRYSKGWLSADEVKSELAAAGLDSKIQDRVYQWIVKQSATERVAKERDLTVTDIIKGVKKGTVTRAEGQSLIEEMGYDADEAKFKLDINIPVEETTTETKQRELTKSDIINAYKLEKIDSAEVISRLMSIRFSEDDAIFLLNLTNATIGKITEIKQRSLTKADIIKGVKNSVISQEEGYLMLLTIGYDDEDSIFILSVNPITTAGSPDTFNEFLAMTQSYKASLKQPTKEVTVDIIQAEREVKIAQAALRAAKEAKAKAKRIQGLELAIEQAKQRYHQLLTQPKASS